MLFLYSFLGGECMTKFEKALINELKGIRKELQKLNRVESDTDNENVYQPLVSDVFKSAT